ncbi:T9SS type A sorting domain-containing protein [Niastella caeni]|uniref:T9SS type A sorting domain-containing protein n=1 Tax=Niastella caeni TaxID=2569763 RepID=A0A4S8HCM7_9BACT|nr:T9SS type A sorting domain-containing protein [Niastella caeni]THU32515.1 T9SS type A sorting domain-containing protein [Niastella caeni]
MSKNYICLPSRYFFTFLLLFISHLLSAQKISTLAGGSIGDGKRATEIGIALTDALTEGVAIDAAENLYILDMANYRIRKVSAATGIISTYAGNGSVTVSGDGGPALTAGLGYVNAMTCDRAGNIYFSLSGSLRKIDVVTGIITTIAGTGTYGFSGDGGLAINAQIQGGSALTVDTFGNIYLTQTNRIRKITAATGIITTVAGTGTLGNSGDGGLAINANLAGASALTTDNAGNLYFAEYTGNVIRKVTIATGIITRYAGRGTAQGFGGDGGPALAAQFNRPYGIATDAAGNLYLSDNNRIRKINAATGIINTIAGNGPGTTTGDGGDASYASFSDPRHLLVSPAGNVYINDYKHHVIRKITAATNIISNHCGNYSRGVSGIGGLASLAQLYQSFYISVDRPGNIYLSDLHNHKIYRIEAATGIINTVAGTGNQGLNHGNGGPATAANIVAPTGVVTDTSGNFYFIENGMAVRKVNTATGIITRVAGGIQYGYSGDGGPATSALFNRANALALDKAGNLYISDKENHVIRKITAATGIITTVAGSGIAGLSGDSGLATLAKLDKPAGVAVDRSGNIYISDSYNSLIRRVDGVTGIITTFAGVHGSAGYNYDNRLATTATISTPLGITVDKDDNVIFASQLGFRVRKVTIATGIITTIAGNGSSNYNGDNIPATWAGLKYPSTVCLDTAGNLYIGDWGNYRLRKVTYATTPPPAARMATNNPVTTITTDIKTKMYPNPAHESVSVYVQGNFNGKTTITLTDMWGKTIATQQKDMQQNGAFTTTLPLHQLPKGIYFVTVFANKDKQVHKLLVQ